MKLYVSPNSPYARLTRIVVMEKGLGTLVEEDHPQTRTPGSPYYAINPSGRVPFLVTDDGLALEESGLICAYLDSLGEPACLQQASSWEERALEARAHSLLGGLAVLVRENYRPEGERSPTMRAHESTRAQRLFDWWEGAVASPWLQTSLNMTQLLLVAGLDLERRNAEVTWREGRPGLVQWHAWFSERPAVRATRPEPH